MLSGGNLGGYIMKQPKRNEVKLNKKATLAMRKKAVGTKKIKITINFDEDILSEIKKLARNMGAPYQTLLNKMVRDSLKVKKTQEGRLDQLEKEVRALKRKVV